MFLFPTRFSAPVTRKPIPTVLEKKEERKKREEGKRKSFLIIRHVSARYSGSNDSDPIGTPRICIIGTVQTEMKDPVLEGGRRAEGPSLGVLQKMPKTKRAKLLCPCGSSCLFKYSKQRRRGRRADNWPGWSRVEGAKVHPFSFASAVKGPPRRESGGRRGPEPGPGLRPGPGEGRRGRALPGRCEL